MKIIIPALMLIGLGACSIGPSSNIAGISPLKGNELAGLTNTSTQEVAECMARILNVSAKPDGPNYIITTTGAAGPVSFRVRSIKDKYDRYTTQVDRSGAEPLGVPVTASCLTKRVAPRVTAH